MRVRGPGSSTLPGGVQRTSAATASWPSRKTVAVTGSCSPTTARAENDPQDTTGATSVMPRRSSGRPVIGDHAIEVAQRGHFGCGAPPVGVNGERVVAVDLIVTQAWHEPGGWLVSPGASTPTVHRPGGPARSP